MATQHEPEKAATAQPDAQAEAEPGPASADRVQQMLDDALADSFPASDPVSIVTSQHEEAWSPQAQPPRSSSGR